LLFVRSVLCKLAHQEEHRLCLLGDTCCGG
jgi:hypothetical protein